MHKPDNKPPFELNEFDKSQERLIWAGCLVIAGSLAVLAKVLPLIAKCVHV